MVGGLDSGQYSRAAEQPQPAGWSPNYADIATSVVQQRSDAKQYVRASYAPGQPVLDYLQVLESPNYVNYAFGGGGGGSSDTGTQSTQRTAGYGDPAQQYRDYLRSIQNPTGQTDRSLTLQRYAPPYQRTDTGAPSTSFDSGAPTTTGQPGNGQWRAGYGNDVNNNFNPGGQTQTQPSGNGQWRAGYGTDVGTTFRPGGQTQTTGGQTTDNTGYTPPYQQPPATGGQWRPGYGSDVGTTFHPGQTQQGGNGQGRPVYGSDAPANTGQTRDPNANGTATVPTPKWNPQTPPPEASTANPAAAAGTPAAGNGKLTDWQQQEQRIQQVNSQIGPQSGSPYSHFLIGGVGGVIGGTVIPGVMNRYADAVLGNVGSETAANAGMLSKMGWVPDSWKARAAAADESMNSFSQRLAGPEGSIQRRVAEGWRENFDPRFKQQQDLQLQKDARIESLSSKNIEVLQAEQARNTFLENLKTNGKTASEMSQAEAAELSKLQMNLDRAKVEAQALQDTAATTKAGAAAKFGGGLMNNFMRGAAVAGVSMMVNDYLDRFNGNNHKEGINSGIMGLNALSIPIAVGLSSKVGMGGGIALGIGSVVAGHMIGGAIDKYLPGSAQQQFGQALRPNGVDDITMGAAVALPTSDVRTKLALIGTGWTIGRMSNLDAGHAALWGVGGGLAAAALAPTWQTKALVIGLDAAGFLFSRFNYNQLPDNRALNDSAWDSLKKDATTRNQGSMDDSIGKFTELGKAKEGVLQYYFQDWMRTDRKFDDPIMAYRGAVIISSALGQARLEHGTVTKQTNNNPDGYILAGQNLDLGGDALRALLVAKQCVDNAQKITKGRIGQNDQGTKVQQSEIDDLTKVGGQIDATIQNKIYGKHDIGKAISDFSAYYGPNADTAGQLLMRTIYALQVNTQQQNPNKQFLAKLARDAALMEISVANFKLGGPDAGGAAAAFYGDAYNNNGTAVPNGAKGMLDLAKQLDPNNPDLVALQQAANDVEQKLPAAQRKQTSNPIYNPLNVGNQLPATKR